MRNSFLTCLAMTPVNRLPAELPKLVKLGPIPHRGSQQRGVANLRRGEGIASHYDPGQPKNQKFSILPQIQQARLR